MFCTKCGAETLDESAFCHNCGAQLTAPAVAPQPAASRRPLLLAVGAGALVAAVAAIVVVLLVVQPFGSGNGEQHGGATPPSSARETVTPTPTPGPDVATPEEESVSDARYGPVDLPVALVMPEMEVSPEGGGLAPDFLLETLAGGEIRLSDLRGKAVIVNLWATWCAPCRKEMPQFVAAYDRYQAEGLEIIAVNLQESRSVVRPFVEDFGVDFPVALDKRGAVSDEYRVLGLPASYFIDRQGVIRSVYKGPIEEDELTRGIGKILDSSTSDPQVAGPPPVSGETVTTDSGLQYVDIREGDGPMPIAGQVLVVHYTGWLSEDGTKFDSSLDRDTPFEFVLGAGSVIAGWDEGLATMKVGGKRRLIIPPELAYGEQGIPPSMPENAELTFDVELLEIR